jgi:hypothetical protein
MKHPAFSLTIFHIPLLLPLLFLLLGAGMYTYTGPGDRTITGTTCKVELYECQWIDSKSTYKYHKVDAWSCSNESHPWTAYPSSGPACSAATEGAQYWGRNPNAAGTTTTYAPASISASSICAVPGNAGWCRGGPQVNFSVNEPIPGESISRVEGSLNSSAIQTLCSVNAASGVCSWVPADGTSNVSSWAVSTWGDTSLKASLVANVDQRSPALSVPLSPNGANGWYVSVPTVTLTASDATSGLASAQFEDGSTSFTPPGDGVYTLTATALDVAGNSASASLSLKLDTTRPTLDIPLAPDGRNGWYQTRPTIALAAADETSGLDYAAIDLSGSSSFTPESDGIFTLNATARDLAGNAISRSATLKVDATLPELAVPFAPDGANGWYTSLPNLVLSASDATSGLEYARFDLPGSPLTFTPSGDGIFPIEALARDLAGNLARLPIPLKVDGTPPELEIPLAPDGQNGWYVTAPTLTLAASDATSGIDTATFSDGSASVTLADGIHALEASASDLAGNQTFASATVLVDTVPPVLSLSVNNQPVADGWYAEPAGTQARASDSGSGLDLVEYQLNGGAWQPGDSVPVAENGLNEITYRARDRAGNHVLAALALKVDTTPPETTILFPANPSNLSDVVIFRGVSEDAQSGLAEVSYSLDGGLTWLSLSPGDWFFQWDTTTVGDGPFELQVRATDRVGNTTLQFLRGIVANRPPLVSIQERWQAWEAGALSIRPRSVPLESITVTVSCAPAHPNAVQRFDPDNIPEEFRWDLRCGDGAYASFAAEFPVTLTACDNLGRCASASGWIALPEKLATATPTVAATTKPRATATHTAVPGPTATEIPVQVQPEPTAEPAEWSWRWLSLLAPGLFLVFAVTGLLDPRPAALRRLRNTWQGLDRDG